MLHDVMTPDQVAKYLQLDTETVYRLIRIPREDLNAFLLARSTRAEVREARFDRVLAIAQRNPGLSSDQVLDELEREDGERKRRTLS